MKKLIHFFLLIFSLRSIYEKFVQTYTYSKFYFLIFSWWNNLDWNCLLFFVFFPMDVKEENHS